jgi:peptidoglycan/xylan/chitin deacetylase (PgdA/CDA1 family)
MTSLVELLSDQNYTYFDWNVDSGDAGGADSSEQIYNNVVSALKWGGDSIVLQHDIKPHSVEAVEKIIQYGLENNFVFSKLTSDSFNAHHGINN